MKVYNTLTRRKEEFKPIKEGLVTMYSCGPTVYNYAHIGNLRTYVFTDLMRRTFKYCGYKLKGVLNITDVGHLLSDADDGEDKMQLAAKRESKSPYEIAAYYTEVFFKDIAKLNIGKPEIIPKVTDHIKEQIVFVEGLLEKGYAYETSDGIYFDISKFEGYGRLSGINMDEQLAGARVEVNEEKRNPSDFALWKKAPAEHIMQWESPWGMGYPGWHIECSALALKYLGKTFDIHSGGVDHIPIHHENEIAQSTCFNGVAPANYWMHAEFLLVDGGKMSKSLGNTYRISDLEARGYSALDFRFMCLNAHYRKKLNFTFEVIDGAKTALERLRTAVHSHKGASGVVDSAKLQGYKDGFLEAISDDINVPQALGIFFSMIKEEKCAEIYNIALDFDRVLGLDLHLPPPQKEDEELPKEVLEILERRAAARKNKDFALSDKLRAELSALGYTVQDSKDSQKCTKA